MKNMMLKAAIAAGLTAASFGLAGTANAGTLHKEATFESFGPNVDQIIRDLGNGLILTITAGVHTGGNAPLTDAPGRSAQITQTGGTQPGLGVKNDTRGDDRELDNFGSFDYLRFSYNKEVTLRDTLRNKPPI